MNQVPNMTDTTSLNCMSKLMGVWKTRMSIIFLSKLHSIPGNIIIMLTILRQNMVYIIRKRDIILRLHKLICYKVNSNYAVTGVNLQ